MAEQRLVAAFRIEVVGDHKQGLTLIGEFTSQRLAAIGERGVGGVDAPWAKAQLRPILAVHNACCVYCRTARSVNKAQTAIGTEQKANADVAARLAAILI